ncbi:AI-2E family transporter [Patescibacteria group bacterium]
MPRKIEISHKTIIFGVLFILFIWFVYFVRDLILSLFVALLIMAILNPLVTRLTRYKIPRVVSAFLVYVLVIGVLGLAVGSIVGPLFEQTRAFVNNLPKYLNNMGIGSFFGEQATSQLLTQVIGIPGQVFKVGVSVFSNFVLVLGSLVFAFYLLLSRGKLSSQLQSFLGKEKGEEVSKVIDKLEFRLGSWARGELLLMLTVGLATFIGLELLGIPFALPLAVLAGILELIPTLGPIIASIPIIIIGLGISPVIGLASVALVFLINQLENYFLVPKIMEKSVGVSPLATLIFLAVGAKLAGITGILLSVPVFITIEVLIKEYLNKK